MPRKPRKLDVACPNRNCRTYNLIGLRNIVRNGKQPNGTQKYKCTECGRNLVRTINTPFFHKHMTKKEIIRICKLFVEKLSFRAIARATDHHLDTIANLARDIAEHCEAVSDWLLRDVGLSAVEVDEMWSYIKKSKKKLSPATLRTMSKVMHTLTSQSKGKADCT